MITFPNAKINVGLEVLGKRPDGYHNIQSIFYPVNELYDVLEMVIGQSAKDRFFFSGLEIPGARETNLVSKAISILREKHKFPTLDIYLHKVIPMGAGLGGGSSDGAFALMLLNNLFELQLSATELKNLALELGSDCPFFIDNKPTKVSGRGEVFESTDLNLEGKYITVASSAIHISTAEAYKNVSFTRSTELSSTEHIDIKLWKDRLSNSFEPYAINAYPELKKLKQYLLDQDALYVSMTGSGSSFYAIFENEPYTLFLDGFTFWTGKL